LIHWGLKNNTDAIIIDQKPVHASSRSHLLTYLDIFEDVRNYFSNHTGLKKSLFSYNSEGACPECHGKGVLKTELAFMPDFTQICNVCGGKRYKPEVLSATIAGYSIAEPLQSLKATGLNYMSLGQTLDTLSGGEIQRVKLSKYLTHTVSGHIFVFDEPTTGLHEDDIPIILASFYNLIEQGNTVIII